MEQNTEEFNLKKRQIEELRNVDITDVFLLNRACEILENPISTFDTSYNLFSYTQGIVTDDHLWNEITTTGSFSHKSVEFFYSENFVEAYAESEVVSLMKSDKLKYERLNGKIFDRDNVQLANAILIACMRPLKEGDAELFEAFCEILSEKFPDSIYYQKIEKVYQKTLIDRMIDGETNENKEPDKSAIRQLRKNLKKNLYIAIVDIIEYDPTVTHLAYFRDYFRKLQPEYQYYACLNNIIILISTEYKALHIERDLGKLNEFFMKNNIYAGVSSRFDSLSKLKLRYAEAINALNYGLQSKIKRNIFDFNNFRTECVLRAAPAAKTMPANDLVACIGEYDKQHGETLLDTLYAYLLYGGDLPSVAASSGKKENEIAAKIEVLKELFGIDFKNGDMLCSLFISIKMSVCDKE